MPATQSSPECPAQSDDLDQMVKVGLRLGQLLERHVEAAVRIAEVHAATDPTDPFPLAPLPNYPTDVGLTFSRIARAMRLTKALQVRLLQRPSSAQSHTAPNATSGRPRGATSDPVRYLLGLHDPDGDSVEPSDAAARFDHDAWERLEDEDTDADILTRPIPEILAVIRGDLAFAGGSAAPAPATPPSNPEGIGAVRVVRVVREVRGQTLRGQNQPPPEARAPTNTNHPIPETPRPTPPPRPPP